MDNEKVYAVIGINNLGRYLINAYLDEKEAKKEGKKEAKEKQELEIKKDKYWHVMIEEANII